MQVTRKGDWLTGGALQPHLKDQKILSWLHEDGSITSRIAASAEFKLEIISDSLGVAEPEEYQILDIDAGEVRIREVLLYADQKPVVYAKSIIPPKTSSHGYADLGKIDKQPLGDLIFKSELFIRTNRIFAIFETVDGKSVWGRSTQFLVRDYPFSIMEVFLQP